MEDVGQQQQQEEEVVEEVEEVEEVEDEERQLACGARCARTRIRIRERHTLGE